MELLVSTDWLANEIGASDLRMVDADGNLIAKTDYNLAKDATKMAAWLKAARG